MKHNLRALVEIDEQSPLLQFVPEVEYYLVDLTLLREEDLQGAPYLRTGLLTLKLIFDRELARRLPEIFEMLSKAPERPLLEHLKLVTQYLSQVKNANEGRQQGIQQGIQQGMKQGMARGRVEGLTSLTLSLLQRRLGRIPKVTKEQVKGLSAR